MGTVYKIKSNTGLSNFTGNKNENLKKNLLFFVVIAVVSLFVLWRCQFGFASSDEFLHLSLPYRMWQGDALIAEEWHQTQLSAFTYYPITRLILEFSGGIDGLVIYSRIACVILEIIVALFIYFRMKKFSWAGATLSATVFLLFTSTGLYSIFYYSMGIMSMIVAVVLIATAEDRKRADFYFAGICLAVSVLNIPHAAFMYFIYALIVLLAWIKRRSFRNEDYDEYYYASPELFMWLTLGVVSLTVIFIVYLVRNVPLDKFLRSLKPIMIDQHHDITFAYKLIVYFGCIVKYNSKIVGVAMAMLFLEMIFRRKYKDHTYFVAAAVMTILLQLYILTIGNSIYPNLVNYLMFAPNCLALFCTVLSTDRRIHRLFCTVYIPGIVYTFFFNLSSNQGFGALSASITVSTVASIIIIVIYTQEIRSKLFDAKLRNICMIVIAGLFVFQLSSQVYARYTSIYGGYDMKDQTVKLEYGVMEGIITSEELASDYDRYYDIVKTAEENYNYDTVLSATMRTWMCVMFEKEISNYSSYINYVDDEFMQKQAIYFEVNPEKMPDIVYVQEGNEEFVDWFMSKYSGYDYDSYDFGYIIYRQGCKKLSV